MTPGSGRPKDESSIRLKKAGPQSINHKVKIDREQICFSDVTKIYRCAKKYI